MIEDPAPLLLGKPLPNLESRLIELNKEGIVVDLSTEDYENCDGFFCQVEHRTEKAPLCYSSGITPTEALEKAVALLKEEIANPPNLMFADEFFGDAIPDDN
jgi:hypothetical protein